MRRLGRVGTMVVAAAIVAAACGETKSHIVSNGAEHAYFKVPKDFAVYQLPTGRDDRLAPATPEDVELIWSVGFDASATPDPSHTTAMRDFKIGVDAPVGLANIYLVQGQYNQQLSLTIARGVPLGVDPLFVGDSERDLVEIVSYEPLPSTDGLQGSRVLFNLRPTSTDPWRTYDMTTYFDPGRFRMYTFTVGCLSPCFKEREGEIRSITSSWTVEP